MKSNLYRYLEDELVPLPKENFNVLDWWEVVGTHYPTLCMLARDILRLRSALLLQNQQSTQVIEF